MPDFWVRMMPKAALFKLSSNFPRILSVLYYVLMYAVFIGVLLSNLVYEKEKKIKESMLMMGMSNGAFWYVSPGLVGNQFKGPHCPVKSI